MKYHPSLRPHKTRRAFTLVEITATSLMVAIAMTLTLQVLALVSFERRGLDRRQCALQELANQMEHFTSLSWEDLTAEGTQKASLSERAKANLPGAEYVVHIDPTMNPAGKRVSLSLRWRTRQGTWDAPVRLSAWVFPRGGVR